jgi:type VI secretion system protein ImpC
MKSFRPEGIAPQVAELASLLEMRQLVSQIKDRKITIEQFDEQIKQAGVDPAWIERFHRMLAASESKPEPKPPAPSPEIAPPPERESKPEGDVLDSLLGMVDMGDTQAEVEKPSRSHVEGFIDAVLQPGKPDKKADRTVVEAVIDDLDQTIGRQVNEILHQDRFQQLESAWCGLRFLMDRTDFRENIRLEILSVRRDELRDAIYHQVLMPEYNEVSETPLSVMIADYEFYRTPEDIELLSDIAEMCASIHVPFIASVGPEFFGVQTAAELSGLPMLRSYFKEAEYANWGALRDNEDSQYITLTMPRFLLRHTYGPDGKRVKGFNFAEGTKSAADYLWGRGSFAVATTIVRSFAQDGWGIHITGMGGGGTVENLPVWPYRVAGKEVHIPLDVSLTQSREKEFIGEGFALLSSRINDNKAVVLSAPTVYRPKTYADPEETEESRLHATLPYQLFATRMTHYLSLMVREISTGLTAEQVQRALAGKLRLALAKSDAEIPAETVMVEVSDSAEDPEYYNTRLSIRPPFQILGRNVHLSLGLKLHR